MLLDGNALAGDLVSLAADVTQQVLRCRTCAATGPIGSHPVHLTAMGAVLRCRVCGSGLLTVVRRPTGTVVRVTGADVLPIDHPRGGGE